MIPGDWYDDSYADKDAYDARLDRQANDQPWDEDEIEEELEARDVADLDREWQRSRGVA